METHKVKEEIVEPQDYMDKEDELTISQLSLSIKNNNDSAILVKKTKPLETRKRLFKIKKRHLGHTHKAKQVVSHKIVKTSSFKVKRVMMENLSKKVEVNSLVMERAQEVQANLGADMPSFLKMMQPSHCSRGFSVKLPKDFCNMHLPMYDTPITLIDESGEQCIVTFLAERLALSGGWRAFCKKNKLVEGDVLVFQLIVPLKFKVYIVRANALDEVDGALGLLNLDTNITRSDLNNVGNNSEDLGSDTSRHTMSPVVNFKEVKGIENFNILVNGLIIDPELSNYHRIKYYELCCTQKEFLHKGLPKNINSKLAAEIISETINIADALRTCKISTSRDEYALWDRTLESFEVLGMNIGFLRSRLDQLASLAFVSKEAAEARFFRETGLEWACADKEVKTLKSKVLHLKKRRKKLNAKMESLKANVERHELVFQREVNAPW